MRYPFLVASLWLLGSSSAWALTAQEIFRQAGDRIWVLETVNAQDQVVAAASAVAVDTGKAVAQCDVLQGALTIRLVRGEKKIRAEQIGGEDREGLCLLSAPGLTVVAPLEYLPKDPEIGVRVFAVSNALGLGLSISEGVVAAVREFGGDIYIQFTAAIAPGSEGGGLFDTEGRLVGFVTYRARDGQNVNFAIPIRRLADLEKRVGVASAVNARSAAASSLMQESKWAELAQHAKNWLTADADNSEAWEWLSYAAQQLGDWPEVERASRGILKREPNSITASISLSRALTAQKKAQEAGEIARNLLVLRKEDARIWVALGMAEIAAERGKEAKQALERALQVDSYNYEAHLALFYLARAERDWRGAAASLRVLSRITPDDVSIWISLAEMYLYDQRPKRALVSVEQALVLAPDSSDAKLFKGIALVQDRRKREGIQLLHQATTGQTTRPGWAWEQLGSAYYDLKMFPEAINAYTQSLKLQPTSIAVKQGLGLALKEGLRFAEALVVFEELRTANPSDPFPWRQIGYTYGFKMDADNAIPAFKQSLQLDSKQPHVWHALISVYHSAGRKDEIKRAYEQFRTIDAEAAEATYKAFLFPYEGGAL